MSPTSALLHSNCGASWIKITSDHHCMACLEENKQAKINEKIKQNLGLCSITSIA